MRTRIFMVLLLLLATACTKEDGSEVKPEANSETAAANAESNATAESKAAAKSAADEEARKAAEITEAAAAKLLAAIKEEYQSLEDEMKAEISRFDVARRKVKTRAEFTKLNEKSPAVIVGPKYIAFAKKHDGTEVAFEALTRLANLGASEPKTEAMEMLLAIIDADPEHKDAFSTLILIASRGDGESKSLAMSKLLANADANPESKESFDTLKLLAFDRSSDESKTKAIEKLEAMIEAEAGSERAAEVLSLFATRGTGKTKNDAIEKLITDYVSHDKIVPAISSWSRSRPSAETEKWLSQILENTTNPKVEGTALVAKLGMINRASEPDAEELENVKVLMEAFAKDHAGVVKKVESELFALKYLGIDCVAPNIAGVDLDGVQLSLFFP